jgi:hypothetical protein
MTLLATLSLPATAMSENGQTVRALLCILAA